MAGSSSRARRPPPALQKSLSRRVSFNESTINSKKPPPSSDFDMESQISSSSSSSAAAATCAGHRRRGFCSSLCGSCCAIASTIVAVLLLLALLLGGIYFAFLQSILPEVRLQRLDVANVTVDGETLVAADIEARLNATNGSGRIELWYVGVTAVMSSEGIEFGDVRLADMRQQPHETAEIRVRSVVRQLAVEEAAGKDLAEKAGRRMLVINVVVKGHVDYYFRGKQINGLPFKIDCHDIDQTEIDGGHAPRCNTKLNPFG